VKRPAFQFYPADWRKDAALQSCSIAARGFWLEAMCIAHECEPYGHLTVNGRAMSTPQLARLVGISPKESERLLAELDDAGVTSRSAEGAIFSRRMVRDEDIRNRRAAGGVAGAEHGIKGAEDGKKGGRPPIGRGVINPPSEPPPSSSSSSSSSEQETSKLSLAPARPSAEPPDCPHQEILALWAEVLPALPQHLTHEWKGARADHLRARWRETAVLKGWADKAPGLAYFRKLFAHVGRSAFLTGRTRQSDPARRPFVIELEWLVNPTNWAKVHEGKYHQDAA
jgi:hypothetical protein